MRLTRGAKFKNVRANGFDSKREAKRYADLRLLERAGEITQLERQVEYILLPAQYVDGKCVERGVKYRADFRYRNKDGSICVEDSKGFRTADYILKRKLVLFFHGITIKES